MNNRDTESVTRLLREWSAAERTACSCGPGAALLQHLEKEMRATQLDREIQRVFPWVAAAALAAAVILAWLNLSTLQDPHSHPLDTLFGLPQPTLEESLSANL